MIEPIKLTDGTELIPLEQTEKDALELEIKAVLDKYNASYLPSIKEEKTLTSHSITAVLFLLKKKDKGIISPYNENGENNGTTEETPKVE